MEETNNRPISKLLSESLKITILTIYAYLIIYIYEAGYFLKFNIPLSFIEINLSRLFEIFLIMLIVIVVIWIFIEIIHGLKISKHSLLNRILYLSVIILITVISDYIFGKFKWHDFILPALLALFLFIHPLIIGKGIKGFDNKVWRQYEVMYKHEPVVFKISEKLGISFLNIVLIGIILIWLSFHLGALVAKIQTRYLILKTTPELLVLRNYGQKYLCCEFDGDKKEIIEKYYYKTLDRISDDGIMIIRENVGPLKSATIKTPKKQPIKINKEEIKLIEDKKAVADPKGGIK